MPRQCNLNDIQAGYESLAVLAGMDDLEIPVSGNCGIVEYKPTIGTYVMWSIFSFIGLCMVIGTFLEIKSYLIFTTHLKC